MVTHAWYSNPSARSWVSSKPVADTRAFHEALPGYAATRLVELPSIAEELGVAHVVVKEESRRIGLPAFKILGASYAISRALSQRLGSDDALPLHELRGRLDLTIVAATDGNHGRAVAHVARLVGLPARIHVPGDITEQAKAAIAGEGAELVVLDEPYDAVVRVATAVAESLGPAALLVQDSSWPGYERVPGWIVDGYSTLFREADDQLAAMGLPPATLVTAPSGVGALAEAALDHYRRGIPHAPAVLVVEPVGAACILESLHAGQRVDVEIGFSIMKGLNCGVVSPGAWPTLRDGVDAAITVTEQAAATAVRDLRALGVDSGPCGASSLAAVRALCADPERRGEAGIGPESVLLLLSTESLSANPIDL
jgi:diaminopropionate ammonia-lyase